MPSRGSPMSATPCLLKLPENCSKVLEAIKTGARLIAEGKLHLPIAAVYPLSAAHEAIMHAQRGGKVLFACS